MEQRMCLARQVGAACLLLTGALWVTGCGSSGSSGGSTNRLTGTVEAPEAQVASVSRSRTDVLARILTLGSPVQAEGAVSRRPVRGATVRMARVSDGAEVSRATTDDSGKFVLDGAVSGTAFLVTATATGSRGQMTLQSIVRVDAGGQATVTVNEATTVGAQAAVLAALNGADEATIVQTATRVSGEHETAEASDPSSIPDLADATHARGLAAHHMTSDMAGMPMMGGQTGSDDTSGAVLGSQVAAHMSMGMPDSVHMSHSQMQAIMDAMSAGKSFTLAEVAAALNTAGIKAGEAAVTEANVQAALDALKARPEMKDALANLPDGKVPIMVAVMLAEQVNDAAVPFHIATQDQLNAYISALVGVPVEGPTGTMPMGTGMMGSSGGMMSGAAMMGGSSAMMSGGSMMGSTDGSTSSGGTTAADAPGTTTDGTTGGDAASTTGGHDSHH